MIFGVTQPIYRPCRTQSSGQEGQNERNTCHISSLRRNHGFHIFKSIRYLSWSYIFIDDECLISAVCLFLVPQVSKYLHVGSDYPNPFHLRELQAWLNVARLKIQKKIGSLVTELKCFQHSTWKAWVQGRCPSNKACHHVAFPAPDNRWILKHRIEENLPLSIRSSMAGVVVCVSGFDPWSSLPILPARSIDFCNCSARASVKSGVVIES